MEKKEELNAREVFISNHTFDER